MSSTNNDRQLPATGSPKHNDDFPRAILYSYKASVWASVPLLALVEKGYSKDDYIVKQVDITKGENFSPSYLKINPNGTIPCLCLPTSESTSPDVPTRYRSLRDTMTIAQFLDQARTANNINAENGMPAPALAPATIEGKTLSDTLIALAHQPTVDPNFLFLSARNADELKAKAEGEQGEFVRQRQEALKRYIAEAQKDLDDAGGGGGPVPSFESKTLQFLKEKQEANLVLWSLYNGQAGRENEEKFFEASRKAWSESLPDVLNKLDQAMKGPYALGDHVSLADLHIISWLCRIVAIAGGKADANGVEAIEAYADGKKAGPNIHTFWSKWVERESFKKVYGGGLS